MSVTPAVSNSQFRKDFPEFNSTTTYGESALTFWLTVATAMVSADVWDPNLLNLGIELFAAHNLVIEAQNLATVKVGGIPGTSRGAISSKSVDKASISYDTASTLEPDAGHWNLTVFGTRFINIARMQGAGPLVAVPCSPGGDFSVSGAWSGPPDGMFIGSGPNDP